jgi:hypothetical protein
MRKQHRRERLPLLLDFQRAATINDNHENNQCREPHQDVYGHRAFGFFFFPRQVRGRIPLMKKTTLLAKLTHTTLKANSKSVPTASPVARRPSMIPSVTAGGSSATATITPASTFFVAVDIHFGAATEPS